MGPNNKQQETTETRKTHPQQQHQQHGSTNTSSTSPPVSRVAPVVWLPVLRVPWDQWVG
jgi:hypothetical protein